LNIP
jgi:Ca2+-dependent lipid-binding protein